MRLNKFLAQSGACSRREADRLIEGGRVTVNGERATLGSQVSETDEVQIDGKPIVPEEETILLAYHKPVGVVCTTSEKEPNNIIDALHYPKRIFPVGRLDKESSGLILLTNDGALSDHVLRARYYHEKEYIVGVDHRLTRAFIEGMENGVPLEEGVTRPCKVRQLSANRFSIVLTQGWNRQIRRMCEAYGYRVRDLKRIRVMNVHLGELAAGAYRKIEGAEKKALYDALGL